MLRFVTGRRARRSIGAVVLATILAMPLILPLAAAETVRFRSASITPTPLQLRLARERGQPIREELGDELAGELYRPPGDGPFPAVVSLHGCAGRSSPEVEDASGARYVARGYVLLIVDSFGPRGVIHRCLGEESAAIDRTMDAYGALLYLAGSPFIDPERIAVIGFSQGAGAALSAVALGGVETLFEHHFAPRSRTIQGAAIPGAPFPSRP
jgi:dipeptidyl aminopeptidase/acylaminoacyl peptidase